MKRYITIRDRNNYEILYDSRKFHHKYSQQADPFLFEKEGFVYLFFEEFETYKNGVISLIVFDHDFKIIEYKIILKNKKVHFSYPCLFYSNEILYVIPETTCTKNVQLYEFDFKTNLLNFKKFIFNDVFLCEPTLFRISKNEIVFLANLAFNKIVGFNGNLIYTILDNDFVVIPNFEFVLLNDDARYSRNAGTVIQQSSDRFLRPFQAMDKGFYGSNIDFRELIYKNDSLEETEISDPTFFLKFEKDLSHHISLTEKYITQDFVQA